MAVGRGGHLSHCVGLLDSSGNGEDMEAFLKHSKSISGRVSYSSGRVS